VTNQKLYQIQLLTNILGRRRESSLNLSQLLRLV
jgi:hypothetical protein